MGYGPGTGIGKLDMTVLNKNIDAIVNRINMRQTTIEKEIEFREHEVSVLEGMKHSHSISRNNNKRRIAYIEMELYVLRRLTV